ncbi:MAG: hypothetical protein JJT76_13590 [Clostridiaceae bacterium]|nr:hypothetical protein [Clostridiaceae bacterium]
MKLTSREKKLLIVLVVAVLSWSYFNFLLSPQLGAISELKQQERNYQEELYKVETIVTSEAQVAERLLSITDKLEEKEVVFFHNLNQSQIILLLEGILEETELQIPQISFSPVVYQPLEDITMEVIGVRLSYEGNYTTLLDFLRAIRQQNKKIVLTNLSMARQEGDLLKGDMNLDFYGLPSNEGKGEAILSYNDYLKENPFIAMDGYGIPQEEDSSLEEETYYYNDSPVGNVSGEEETLARTETLYRFKDLDTFFVGHPKGIHGEITMVENSRATTHAIEIKYDFFRNRDENIANIVLEGDVFINKQPETLGLWVYAFEQSSHTMGLVLIDATGREVHLKMAGEIDWTGWRLVESPLPINITYPARIQRIYMESHQQDEKTKGQLILDTIEGLF